MDLDILTVIAILLAVLVLLVLYKSIDLTIKIRNIINVHLKARKIGKQSEETKSKQDTDGKYG
ncbi:hypothetical protein T458_08660 [Brevibacillus panacihumi W25]|uniref:Uncharacterized protein n=1 Tax=Brevibacillus panacihumi W25 TaxID=1408254 RepID=V6MBA9_9BACL|nr:hypothetical protein T458_08660 [Brevibacillus panacihumi W25]